MWNLFLVYLIQWHAIVIHESFITIVFMIFRLPHRLINLMSTNICRKTYFIGHRKLYRQNSSHFPCLYHGTITRAGIAVICAIQFAGGLLLKMLKYYEVTLNIFWIFPSEKNCRILISLCKQVFTNHPIMFLNRDNKTKLVPTSFSYFLELSCKKNKF